MKVKYQEQNAKSPLGKNFLTFLNQSIVLIDSIYDNIEMSENEKRMHMSSHYNYGSSMSILLCIDGNIEFNMGLQSYTLCKNDVLLFDHGVLCEVTYMSADAKFCSMVFDINTYMPTLSNGLSNILFSNVVTKPINSLSSERMTECVNIYQTIKKRLMTNSEDILVIEVIKGYIQALLYNIYASYLSPKETDTDTNAEHKNNRKEDLFNKFIELVQHNYMCERNIKYYAAQLDVTPRYLSQVVRKVSGHFASEHIDNMVINEAKRMIVSRQYSILQISQILHFTSLSFFGRYFKNVTGYSPTQFHNIQ